MNKRIEELVKDFAENIKANTGYDMTEYDPCVWGWDALTDTQQSDFEAVMRFANLVEQRAAAAEREACAKVCLEEAPTLDGQLCAVAIRARGER